jgi:hypothetical protein
MCADIHDGQEHKCSVQKRKTNHLQIITFGSQRTAGPYKRATSGLMHCNNKTDFLIAALQTLLNRISFDSSVKKSERQIRRPELDQAIPASGHSLNESFGTKRPCSAQRSCQAPRSAECPS